MKQVGFFQFDCMFGEVERNLESMERAVREASGADLLVFPELATSGYEFKDAAEVESLAEPFGDGPTSEVMLRLAAETRTTLVVGYPEKCGEGCYNACMLATPDGRLANYRKLHLFSRETFLFLPGDAPPPVIDTPAGRIGLMICFDWIFPETARVLALDGAQVIAHPSNLVLDYCQRAMYCRAVENAIYIVTANRIGTESRAGRTLTYTGASQVVGVQGEALVQAPAQEEYLGLARLDPSRADDKRITEYNHRFDDRRIEHYAALIG